MYFIKGDESLSFFLHVSAFWLLQPKSCRSAVHCAFVLASHLSPDTGYPEINILWSDPVPVAAKSELSYPAKTFSFLRSFQIVLREVRHPRYVL